LIQNFSDLEIALLADYAFLVVDNLRPLPHEKSPCECAAMDLVSPDMLFPIDRCSKRVANALLREFEGRVPTVAEVLAYRDNDWLGTPGVGRKALDEIKVIKTTLEPASVMTFRPKMSDAELLLHLNGLVQDMEAIIGKISQRDDSTSGSRGGA
jgi:hypothetical protein